MSGRLSRALADRRARYALAALVAVLGLGALAAAYLLSGQSRLTVGPGAAPARSGPSPRPNQGAWPTYGYVPERTQHRPSDLAPPFRQVWKIRPTGHLLEFPPAIAGGRVYVVENGGHVLAFSARTGRRLWERDLGALAASTPTYQDGRLYVNILCITTCGPAVEGSSSSSGRGRVAALDARTGKTIWKHDLPSRTESSPLVVDNRIYFGSESGTVFGLDVRTGRRVWTYRADGPVKSSLAYDRGRVYFGDYAGAVTSLRAKDGKLVWTRSNVSPENFYGTPSVGFGRIYLTTTDGVLHVLRKSGRLDWSFHGGRYFYSSPALASPKGRPTVFLGGWSSRFYAFDAISGHRRWSIRTPSVVQGTASVIGDYVYFSSCPNCSDKPLGKGGKMTYGVRASDGRVRFRIPQSAFTPAVADRRHLYLVGQSTIRAFVPRGRR